MSTLRQALNSDCAALVKRISRGKLKGGEVLARAALDHLIDWSVNREASLEHAAATETDAFGVAKLGNDNLLWRAYPSGDNGGKCCLYLKESHARSAAARRDIIRIFHALGSSLTYSAGEKLDIYLPKIANASKWATFDQALELAYQAN